jgi:hypothetical protein
MERDSTVKMIPGQSMCEPLLHMCVQMCSKHVSLMFCHWDVSLVTTLALLSHSLKQMQ